MNIPKPITVMPVKVGTTFRKIEYVEIPVGHDIGYRCWNANKHNADSAFESGEYGDGLSEDEAYADLLKNEIRDTPKSRVIFDSPFEPAEYDDVHDTDEE